MNISQREEQIASDLYNFAGASLQVKSIAEFLNVSRNYVINHITCRITTMVGRHTGKRYYYRDVARVLAEGENEQ